MDYLVETCFPYFASSVFTGAADITALVVPSADAAESSPPTLTIFRLVVSFFPFFAFGFVFFSTVSLVSVSLEFFVEAILRLMPLVAPLKKGWRIVGKVEDYWHCLINGSVSKRGVTL